MSAEPTLSDLLNRARSSPAFGIQLRIQAAETNADLLKQVDRAVAYAVREMVANRKHKQKLTEDQRTVEIVSLLKTLGLPAIHDAEIGGHTDISISMLEDFIWIAEAKNWRGSAWAFKGFRQLLTRYATGLPGQDNGAVLIYFEQPDAAGLMTKWRTNLSKLQSDTHLIEDVRPLQFATRHTHIGAGTPFSVQHIGVPLYWKPDDD